MIFKIPKSLKKQMTISEALLLKSVKELIELQYNMALDMAKKGIMPGMYTIETKIENDKITLIPKIK